MTDRARFTFSRVIEAGAARAAAAALSSGRSHKPSSAHEHGAAPL